MPEVPNTSHLYGEFMRDIVGKDLQILPDEQVRDRIVTIRSATSTDEERAAARNQVIESSLRMIPYAIRKSRNPGIPPQELVGEAFEVIDSCIDNVDLDFISPRTEDQVKFSSYVFASLEKALRSPRSVVKVGEHIKIPAHTTSFVSAMRTARELFMQEESREPNHAEWYNRTLKFIDEARSSSAAIPNLDMFNDLKTARFSGVARIGKGVYRGNIDTDTSSPAVGAVEETIADPDADTFEAVSKLFLEGEVDNVLRILSPRERRVIELRFGLGFNEDGERPDSMTSNQVAEIFNVTRSRIHQIEGKALKKLRKKPNVLRSVKEYVIPPREETQLEVINKQYERDISRIADRMLAKLTPQSTIDLLENLRKGSTKNGRLDSALLSNILESDEIAKLIESEEKYFRFKPPRVITQDIVLAVNSALQPYHFRKDLASSPWATIKEIKLKEEE